ncbi:hypothetical protein ACQJBY_036159 [Aegilops geniculata]
MADPSFFVGIVEEADAFACMTQCDLPEGRAEQEHGGVPVAAVRHHPPLHLPLGLLWPPQARRPPHHHRQRRRRRSAGHLRRPLPRLCPQGHQGEDGQGGGGREHLLLCRRHRGGAGGAARRRPAVRGGGSLLRSHHRNVCCTHGRNEDSGEDPERGVHALLPVLLPLPQRRHLERLLPALHRDPQRHGFCDGHGAAGALHGVPEQEEACGAQGGGRGEGGGAPDGPGRAWPHQGAVVEEGAEPADALVPAVALARVWQPHQGLVRHPPGAAVCLEPARARRC